MMFAITFNTESGDTGFVGLYSARPSEEQLAAIGRESYPEEAEDGCIYFTVYEVYEVEDLPA